MLERLEQSPEVLAVERESFRACRERVPAGADDRQRRLLDPRAERGFGRQAGARVARPLDGIGDPEQFEEAGDWIIACRESSELIAGMEGLPVGPNGAGAGSPGISLEPRALARVALQSCGRPRERSLRRVRQARTPANPLRMRGNALESRAREQAVNEAPRSGRSRREDGAGAPLAWPVRMFLPS